MRGISMLCMKLRIACSRVPIKFWAIFILASSNQGLRPSVSFNPVDPIQPQNRGTVYYNSFSCRQFPMRAAPAAAGL